MTDARTAILQRLRAGGRPDEPCATPTRDAFAEAFTGSRRERFTELATANLMAVVGVASRDEAPVAIAAWLESQALPLQVVTGSNVAVPLEAWSAAGIAVEERQVAADGDTLVSECFGAVAENGAVVLSSAGGHDFGQDFLARTHIVLLPERRLVANLAELWEALRGEATGGWLPRALCLSGGPSRTADLGVPAKMGAHGPERVLTVIIES